MTILWSSFPTFQKLQFQTLMRGSSTARAVKFCKLYVVLDNFNNIKSSGGSAIFGKCLLHSGFYNTQTY